MEPLAETVEAMQALSLWGDNSGLLEGLLRLAERAREVVPDLVGVSLSRLDEGLTFTVVASAAQVAVLDGVQYLGGGPCVEGAHSGRAQTFEVGDVLDEERWRFFAELTAADGVRSTLTMPIVLPDAAGSVNLYAASGRAFVGHHEEMAEIFGAWAEAAVADADLGFSTVYEGVGLLAARFGVDIEAAEQRLHDAASRAGVTVTELARFLIDAHVESLNNPAQPDQSQ